MLRFLFAVLTFAFLLAGCAITADKPCCDTAVPSTKLQGDTLRLLSLNLAHGRGDSINQMLVDDDEIRRNLDRIGDLLVRADPDVAAFQEADDPSRWSGGFDHVAYLAEKTGWPNYVHRAHADSWLFAYGTAILTPHSIERTYVHDFPPSFPTTNKGFVAATLEWRSGDATTPITLISAHLDFSRRSVREEQIAEIVAYVRKIDGPYVIAGDLNGDWRDGRSVVRGIIDELGVQIFRPDADDLGTYKSQDGKRLDWILISQELEFADYKVLPDIVSDHLALVADIRLR